jgi:hypothetical protein
MRNEAFNCSLFFWNFLLQYRMHEVLIDNDSTAQTPVTSRTDTVTNLFHENIQSFVFSNTIQVKSNEVSWEMQHAWENEGTKYVFTFIVCRHPWIFLLVWTWLGQFHFVQAFDINLFCDYRRGGHVCHVRGRVEDHRCMDFVAWNRLIQKYFLLPIKMLG